MIPPVVAPRLAILSNPALLATLGLQVPFRVVWRNQFGRALGVVDYDRAIRILLDAPYASPTARVFELDHERSVGLLCDHLAVTGKSQVAGFLVSLNVTDGQRGRANITLTAPGTVSLGLPGGTVSIRKLA